LVSLNPLKIFGKKDDGHLEFKRQVVCNESMKNDNTAENDYINATGKMGYLLYDEQVTGLLFDNKALQPLIPVLSLVNSTTKLSPHQADLKRIRMDNFFTMMKLTMDPKTYEANGMEMLDGLRMFGHDRVSDAEEGWKGHITTEQTRRISVEERKK
jgi:hypothetical protein